MGEIKGMNEKVSVIMPIYNVEKYLRESIESVLHQTYGNFELFLVDDGSPDNCPQIIDEYAQMDKRIIAIHQDNAGVDAARNNAIDRANGKYIAFIDSDDAYEKKYLELLVNAIEKILAICQYVALFHLELRILQNLKQFLNRRWIEIQQWNYCWDITA